MNEFSKILKENLDLYLSGYITRNEIFNYILNFVSKNIDSLKKVLPPELKTIAEKYALGLSAETYIWKRWFRLIDWFIDNPDKSYLELVKNTDSVFATRYVRHQKFKVCKAFTISYTTSYRAPYSGGGKAKVKKGLVLYASQDVFHDETEMTLYPLDYFDFQKKYISPDESLDYFYLGYLLYTEIEKLEKYCDKCSDIATKEEIIKHGGVQHNDWGTISKN